jgi:hypothetical protein
MRHCSAISLSSREPPFVTGHSDRLAGAVKPQARRLTGLDVCDRYWMNAAVAEAASPRSHYDDGAFAASVGRAIGANLAPQP